MHILWSLIVGLVVGAIAKWLMPGRDPGGTIITMLVGVAGSVIANFAGHAAGLYAQGEKAGLLASVLGAIALLAVYRLAKRSQVPPAA